MRVVMIAAHEIRRAAARQFGGSPSDNLMSIALEMAWEAHKGVIEMSMKDRIEQRLIKDNGILDGYNYRDNDEGGFDVLRREAGYAKIRIDGDRVSVGAFGFKSCSGYSRDLDEADGGYQDYRY